MDERTIVIGASIMAGVLAAQFLSNSRQQRSCPDCHTPLPRYGIKHVRSIWWGGWVCPKCGCETDRNGKKLRNP